MLNGIKAAAFYYTVVFAAGFVFGMLRVLVLAPQVGERLAVLLELPFMLTISWFACRWLIDRFSVPAALVPRLAMGIVAFALLMAAEIGISVFGLGRTLAQHLESLLTGASLLGLTGQIVFALFPVIQMPMRGRITTPRQTI
jgi:hypothetical protein